MTIYQVQCLLGYLGYSPGLPDNVAGTKTSCATSAFQADYGLPVTGTADDVTCKMLVAAVAGTAAKVEKAEEKTGTFWDGIKYFKREEFRCPCGKCGGFPVEPDERLVKALVAIREYFNAPITIIPLPPANPHAGGSGVRCQEYNDSLPGSVSNSRHVQGKAADFTVRGFSGEAVKSYCDGLISSGWLRFCYVISGNSVHIDVL